MIELLIKSPAMPLEIADMVREVVSGFKDRPLRFSTKRDDTQFITAMTGTKYDKELEVHTSGYNMTVQYWTQEPREINPVDKVIGTSMVIRLNMATQENEAQAVYQLRMYMMLAEIEMEYVEYPIEPLDSYVRRTT